MIERQAFVVGLSRLAVALRQPLDEATFAGYYEIMRDLVTDAVDWADFTIDANRKRRFDWFPRLDDLQDAYRAWRSERVPKLMGRAADPTAFWSSMDQKYLVEAVVEEHPMVEGEQLYPYLERLCLEAGLLKVEDAIIHRQWPGREKEAKEA